ncbi:MAG: tRNA pseudouridine(38-40) synthase TruA [Erysipelotrichaceae bacterium]
MSRRYLVSCQYDGSAFMGWQLQPELRSVSAEILKALKAFHKKDIVIYGCSRTDALVHASDQRFHFDSDLNISADKMKIAINTYLPEDIVVNAVELVDSNFHARYHATAKEYQYLINNGVYDIFRRNYQVHIKDGLDVEKMKEASKLFLGEHDFTSFNASPLKEIPNQVRKISKIDITKDQDIISISYQGTGFLRYMVRMLSQCLIEVGLNKITLLEVKEMLEKKDKDVFRLNGEPQGLYLRRIYYD